MKNKKIKIVLAVITVALLAFMFKSNIIELFSAEIPGCMDKNCTAFYNPKANVDDGSCKCDDLVSDSLLKRIQAFKQEDWNSDEFKRLKNHIYIVEEGNQKALNILNDAYMVVLNRATKTEASKCFESAYMIGDTLENEVEIFYKDYKSKSTEIQIAMNWFNKYHEVKSFPYKVNKIVRKQFSESNFNALKKQITNFSRSSEYRDKLKDCSKLSTIISANLVKLSDYKKIEEAYKNLKREDKRRWNVVFSIGDYKDYAWYHQELVRLDNLLKERRTEEIKTESYILQLKEKRESLIIYYEDSHHPKVFKVKKKIEAAEKEKIAKRDNDYRSW